MLVGSVLFWCLCLAVGAGAMAQESSPAILGAIDWPAPVLGPQGIVLAVLPFGGGLVAAGQVQDGATTRAAAWWSGDGSSWERTFRQGRKRGYSAIQHVVVTSTGLVGMGPTGVERCTGEGEGDVECDPVPIAVWRSADGHAWERVALHGSIGRGAVTALATGPLGLLAVGVDQDGVATTWRSTDGLAWTAATLTGEGFDRARLDDVAALGDGWLMVGSTGGRDVPAGGVAAPNGSVGAAWTSGDGVAWQPAHVAGAGEQVELRSAFVGADGLSAVGTLTGGNQAAVWVSPDGTDWSLLLGDDDDAYQRLPVASDGQTVVGTSQGDAGMLDWWASTDGVTWAPLVSVGEAGTAPRWDGGVAPDTISLVDGGLVVTGQSGPNELIWLAPLEPPGQPSPSAGGLATPGAALDGHHRAVAAGVGGGLPRVASGDA